MMSKSVDVLVITPPRKSVINNVIVNNYPPNNQGIDSIPLRLAAVVEKKYTVGFFPFYYTQYNYLNIDLEEVEKVLKKYQPKILIISTDYFISNRTTSTVQSSLVIMKEYKKLFKNGKTIVTGKHAIVNPEDYFNDNCCDVAVMSEAENIINEVIKALLDNNYESLKDINNLMFFENEVIKTELREENVDVNKLPVPAFNLLAEYIDILIEKEKPIGDKVSITLRSSYGCVYNCPFCGGLKNWNNYRMRNAEGLKKDIDYMKSCLGNKAEIVFLDDELFTMNKEHVIEVGNVFNKEGIYIQGVLTHVNYFNEEIAEIICKFSHGIIFGGENFCDNILEDINKNQNVEKILKACSVAKKYNLDTRIEYIVGLPSETPKTIVKNINFIYNAICSGKIDIVVPYVLVPHPGTKFNISSDEYGINIIDNDYSNYIEEGNYPVYETNRLTRAQIYIYYLLLLNNIYAAKHVNKVLGNDNYLSNTTYSEDLFVEFFNNISSHGN
ncbi:B12-binding domain-containing radical SAM protein [Clostridium putrefaciens]|nr:radical SAM protein [Clostridium putrefaciens]